MTKLRLVQTEKSAKLSAPPRRKRIEGRKHVTPEEFEKIRAAARKRGRYPVRDTLLVTMMYRHGLRISEAVSMTWDDIVFGRTCTVHITRKKGSNSGTHYLDGDEVRMLRAVRRAESASRFVFTTERGGPMAIRTARRVITAAAQSAGVPVTNPHSLRHGAGYRLTRRGIDLRRIGEFLGHRDPKSTLVYSALDPGALAGLERD